MKEKEGKECPKCGEWKEFTAYHKNKTKKDGHAYSCKECCNAHKREHYIKNKSRIRKQRRAHYKDNKAVYSEANKKYYAERRKRDPAFALRGRVSVAVGRYLRKEGAGKDNSTWKALPYTTDEMRRHLESLFTDGMSWENYGEWQIDHIYPQSRLPYDSLEHPNFKIAWSLKNLRPLWAADNLKKGDKVTAEAAKLLSELKKELDIP